MGLNAIKCEGYSNVGKCEFGKETVSASDFSVDDKLLKAAGIVAIGLAAAGCIGNGNGNKQEAKYEPSEATTTTAPAVENSTNDTTTTTVNATVATPPEILVKYDGGTAYCSLPPGANLTEGFVRECIGKDMPFYGTDVHQSHEYLMLRNKVLYGIVEQQHPESVPVDPDSEFAKFTAWLAEDKTNEHPYIKDTSKAYGEWYVCTHFSRDFAENATKAGFDSYAVLLTGNTGPGRAVWHAINAVILDKKLVFVNPQNDQILASKKEVYDWYSSGEAGYQYEYASFGKTFYISRNEAILENPVRYNEVIGTHGENFIYLKG